LNDSIVETNGLTKRFGSVLAVDGVNLNVKEGDLFGFLGPNGSGKTTTVRMLLGLVFPTSGEVRVLGERMPRHAHTVLPQVGTLVEGPAFYPHLTGATNLAMFDAAGQDSDRRTRKQRINTALERVGLARYRSRAVKAYSSGMKQRLALAAALLRPHRLLVLDEPTNGLDPRGMQEIRSLLIDMNRNGTTVLLSSHLLNEVRNICNRAAIIYEGRLVAHDEVNTLLAPTGRVWIDTPDLDQLAITRGVTIVERAERRVAVHLDGVSPEELNARLHEAGVRVSEFVIERPTLEQVFLRLTESSDDDSR
jgi:ABC-type multidrug transport system ATPase subunit